MNESKYIILMFHRAKQIYNKQRDTHIIRTHCELYIYICKNVTVFQVVLLTIDSISQITLTYEYVSTVHIKSSSCTFTSIP